MIINIDRLSWPKYLAKAARIDVIAEVIRSARKIFARHAPSNDSLAYSGGQNYSTALPTKTLRTATVVAIKPARGNSIRARRLNFAAIETNENIPRRISRNSAFEPIR
jgi:hypothetical protein